MSDTHAPIISRDDLLSLADAAMSAPPDLTRGARTSAEEWLKSAFQKVDKAGVAPLVKAQLSNAVAREIMGWSLRDGDHRRIWRDPDGQAVTWAGQDGKFYALCAQPWIDYINKSEDLAFSPGTNYHTNLIADWREVALQEARTLDTRG